MRWKNVTPKTWRPDTLMRAAYKLYEAYGFGIIGWNIFNIGLEKVERVKRGSWMFEKPKSRKNNVVIREFEE
jgi:hypothetical protein